MDSFCTRRAGVECITESLNKMSLLAPSVPRRRSSSTTEHATTTVHQQQQDSEEEDSTPPAKRRHVAQREDNVLSSRVRNDDDVHARRSSDYLCLGRERLSIKVRLGRRTSSPLPRRKLAVKDRLGWRRRSYRNPGRISVKHRLGDVRRRLFDDDDATGRISVKDRLGGVRRRLFDDDEGTMRKDWPGRRWRRFSHNDDEVRTRKDWPGRRHFSDEGRATRRLPYVSRLVAFSDDRRSARGRAVNTDSCASFQETQKQRHRMAKYGGRQLR